MYSCSQKPEISASIPTDDVFNEAAELDSILKTIEVETTCFFQRDLDCWKKY